MKRPSGRNNQLRIIGGKWRGRKLQFPTIEGLRPTGDRIRETLFNWLAPHIHGARCLDLFAGSGALGLEALSRGAASVTFVDQSREACDNLKQHLTLLQADQGRVIQSDAQRWNSKDESYDIIFLDPPFDLGMLDSMKSIIGNSIKVCEHSLIYIEQSLDEANIDTDWQLLKSKSTGAVQYNLYQI